MRATDILGTVAPVVALPFSLEGPAPTVAIDIDGGKMLEDVAAAGRDLGEFYRDIARELVPM